MELAGVIPQAACMDPHHDSLLRNLPLPAVIVSAASDLILGANAAAGTLLRNPAPNGTRLSRHIAPGFPELAVFAEEIAYRGSAWTRALRLRDAGSPERACEIRGQLIRRDPVELMLVFIDLEEQQQHAEATLAEEIVRGGLLEWDRVKSFFDDVERGNHLILEAAGEGIYGLNAEGKTTFVNRAAQEMLGWSAEDLVGHDIHQKIHHHHLNGDIYHSRHCPIYKTFRFEQTHRIEDEVFWRKDGKPIRVEYTSTPIYDHGLLAGAVVIFRDITERKENEARLRAAMTEIADLRDRLEQENAYLQEEILSERAHHEIIGTSQSTQDMIARLDIAAQSSNHVLITGEPGTGKSLVASVIHKSSDRKRRPLISVKCSAISEGAMEAELMGQIRGAFTGALRDKPGRLELAHGGVLFLEAVEALPYAQQGRLVEVLETGVVQRLGDVRTRRVDVRIIASTSVDLARAVAEGQFREDLYFLLNVLTVDCAPLRDRLQDIGPLTAHLLRLSCERLGRALPVVTEGTMRELSGYHWPGNVRELANVIERATITSPGDKLVVELPRHQMRGPQTGDAILREEEIEAIQRDNILRSLRETGGKISGKDGAAALIGIKPTTLRSRIEKYGISAREWL